MSNHKILKIVGFSTGSVIFAAGIVFFSLASNTANVAIPVQEYVPFTLESPKDTMEFYMSPEDASLLTGIPVEELENALFTGEKVEGYEVKEQ